MHPQVFSSHVENLQIAALLFFLDQSQTTYSSKNNANAAHVDLWIWRRETF